MLHFGRFFLFVLCCATALPAEENLCTDRSVIVAVRDTHTKAAPYTIRVADFRAKIDGKPVKVLGATRAAGSPRIVFVLDASGSMGSPAKWQTQVSIAGGVIHNAPNSTQLAVVVFADKVIKTFGFGKSGLEILDELTRSAFPRQGQTALRDALLEAAKLLEPAREGDSIVIVSDGEDNHSKVSIKALQEAYLSQGIRMFFARFNDQYLPTQINTYVEFAYTPAITGGRVSVIDRPDVALEATRDFASDIENYSVLNIRLNQPPEKPTSLQLELVDSDGVKRKDLELMFPQKVLPCGVLRARP